MIPIERAFIGLVLLFGIIGSLRGWAKELLVTFSVILARFVEYVMWNYVPVVSNALQLLSPNIWFYIRLILFVVIVWFGYATTVISSALGARARREKFQDALLGMFLGCVNGFLIVGMVWGFLNDHQYNIWGISAPTSPLALGLIEYLPLQWLEGPLLFIAVAVAFVFVLVVFV